MLAHRRVTFLWRLLSAIALSPVCNADAAQITFTPRFSGYFDNSSQQQSTTQVVAEQGTAARIAATSAQLRQLFGPTSSFIIGDNQIVTGGNQIFYPLYGGSVTFSPTGEERTQLTLTVLYGRSSSNVSAISRSTQRLSVGGITAEDLVVTSSSGRVRSRRLDIEATFQDRLNEAFSFVGGVRLERVDSRLTVAGDLSATQNGANLVNALLGGPINLGLATDRFVATSRGSANTYSARVGAAALVPVDQRNLIYVNGLLHISHLASQHLTLSSKLASVPDAIEDKTRRPSETTIGPDISVGYLRHINERAAIDVRYRGVFYFAVNGPRSFSDPRVNHGIMLGVSYTFGTRSGG